MKKKNEVKILHSVFPSKSEAFVLGQLTLREPSMELGEVLVEPSRNANDFLENL